jgi:hypothetical protein
MFGVPFNAMFGVPFFMASGEPFSSFAPLGNEREPGAVNAFA